MSSDLGLRDLEAQEDEILSAKGDVSKSRSWSRVWPRPAGTTQVSFSVSVMSFGCLIAIH